MPHPGTRALPLGRAPVRWRWEITGVGCPKSQGVKPCSQHLSQPPYETKNPSINPNQETQFITLFLKKIEWVATCRVAVHDLLKLVDGGRVLVGIFFLSLPHQPCLVRASKEASPGNRTHKIWIETEIPNAWWEEEIGASADSSCLVSQIGLDWTRRRASC